MKMKIKITENGPYHVTGGVPLKEKIITKVGKHYVFEDGCEFPLQEEYYLCRCGHSKNAPFCDGAHVACGFDGTEVADKTPYLDRLEGVVEGEEIELLDDGRCAFARFCHREGGDVWGLTENDEDGNNKEEAIIAANECPAGRLVMIDKEGKPLLDDLEPEIIIAQDPEKSCSASIFVRGPIEIEGADGTIYEQRNRRALCRCGHSSNMPFCDAAHVPTQYHDRSTI
ncbi:CDGSH-type Zn-finger protein [Lachnospiraceae bacterium PM6-15]|uniref:CDGSH iron-sulfur domain-containing protein n=1 Tax=Ohessyouella blattaphilus TaxID=2949333 RepID=UPI003E2C90E3